MVILGQSARKGARKNRSEPKSCWRTQKKWIIWSKMFHIHKIWTRKMSNRRKNVKWSPLKSVDGWQRWNPFLHIARRTKKEGKGKKEELLGRRRWWWHMLQNANSSARKWATKTTGCIVISSESIGQTENAKNYQRFRPSKTNCNSAKAKRQVQNRQGTGQTKSSNKSGERTNEGSLTEVQSSKTI